MYRGVAQSLLEDMVAGYTRSLQELIHSDVFSDYFDMVEHLLESGYKDAAAVITGSITDRRADPPSPPGEDAGGRPAGPDSPVSATPSSPAGWATLTG